MIPPLAPRPNPRLREIEDRLLTLHHTTPADHLHNTGKYKLLVRATAKQGTDQHQLGSIRCYPLTYHPSQLEHIFS